MKSFFFIQIILDFIDFFFFLTSFEFLLFFKCLTLFFYGIIPEVDINSKTRKTNVGDSDNDNEFVVWIVSFFFVIVLS